MLYKTTALTRQALVWTQERFKLMNGMAWFASVQIRSAALLAGRWVAMWTSVLVLHHACHSSLTMIFDMCATATNIG